MAFNGAKICLTENSDIQIVQKIFLDCFPFAKKDEKDFNQFERKVVWHIVFGCLRKTLLIIKSFCKLRCESDFLRSTAFRRRHKKLIERDSMFPCHDDVAIY